MNINTNWLWVAFAAASALPLGYYEGRVMISFIEGGPTAATKTGLTLLIIAIVGYGMYLIGLFHAADKLAVIIVWWEVVAILAAYVTMAIQGYGLLALSNPKVLIGIVLLGLFMAGVGYAADLITHGLEEVKTLATSLPKKM